LLAKEVRISLKHSGVDDEYKAEAWYYPNASDFALIKLKKRVPGNKQYLALCYDHKRLAIDEKTQIMISGYSEKNEEHKYVVC
jgi:hypothetical protein